MSNISKTAKIGNNVELSNDVIIEDGVEIGDGSFLDHGVIIRRNVKIGKNSFVGVRCIIGEYNVGFINNRLNYNQPELLIGENAIIRSDTVIYAGSVIGANLQTGHRVTIREKAEIGNNFRVGTLSDIQGDCIIGDYVNLHSNVHIGQKSKIGNYVWIFPYAVLTNDPTPPSLHLLGVTVEDFAVIATMSVILPGVVIKRGSLIGAGSIVTKDVNAEMVAVGNPAKEITHITKIKNKITGKDAYPWYKQFDRGMPWQGLDFDNWFVNNNKAIAE